MNWTGIQDGFIHSFAVRISLSSLQHIPGTISIGGF